LGRESFGGSYARNKTIFDAASASEITIEANPRSFDERKLAAWLAAGINRISLGVQSLDEGALKFLGRIHDAREAERALSALAESGVNFGADVIYGFKGDSPDRVKKDVEKNRVAQPVSHKRVRAYRARGNELLSNA
jgi:oxygen-independent coproporphyrinogen-3 oxidase